MGNRGSKSNNSLFVKEQRVDGSSVLKKKYCKVYSSRHESGIWVELSNSNLKILY